MVLASLLPCLRASKKIVFLPCLLPCFPWVNELQQSWDVVHLSRFISKGQKGYVVLMSVGEEAVLTALAREQAKLGLILLDMRRAAEDLSKLI